MDIGWLTSSNEKAEERERGVIAASGKQKPAQNYTVDVCPSYLQTESCDHLWKVLRKRRWIMKTE